MEPRGRNRADRSGRAIDSLPVNVARLGQAVGTAIAVEVLGEFGMQFVAQLAARAPAEYVEQLLTELASHRRAWRDSGLNYTGSLFGDFVLWLRGVMKGRSAADAAEVVCREGIGLARCFGRLTRARARHRRRVRGLDS